MKKAVKPLLIGSGIAALGMVAAGAASVAATGSLVKIAMDRQLPRRYRYGEKGRTRLTGSPADHAMLQTLAAAGKRLQAAGCRPMQLTARDGTRLTGHWRSAPDPKRVILAMHGWRSSWDREFGVIADFWYEQGCSVLFAEQRGQGSSGGEYMGFGMTEQYDCLDWVRLINEKTGGTMPIYLGGVSMGVTTVLMASGLPMPANVRGIVADCGFTSPKAIWQHVAKHNLHMPYGPREALVDALCRRRIHMASGDYSTVEALRKTRLPVLLIHGEADSFVPVEMTYENYRACGSSKKLLVVPGAGHGGSYLKDPEAYRQALVDFWRENDTRPL